VAEVVDHSALYWSLLSEFNTPNDYPSRRPFLAHYTSIETAFNILQTKQVLMGNPFLMNDRNEARFGLDQALKLIKMNVKIDDTISSPTQRKIFIESFESFVDHFQYADYMNLFVFCCSEHAEGEENGKLSMWRGYGGNGKGAAIVFDTRNLDTATPSPFLIIKVRYMSDEGRINWIKNKILEFCNYAKGKIFSDLEMHTLAFFLFQAIKIFSITSKHYGFEEENEWRVIYLDDRDDLNLKGQRQNHIITSKGLEPRLIYRFSDIKNSQYQEILAEELIHKIILGPSSEGHFALETFKRVLDRQGFANIRNRVVSSSIPFRA
jgi:hypothetical protein